ncbi:MAG TPA: DsrE family protein [Nitrospiraceae bacterium]|nr:DsrE family protein [Nitrospiraceae bacterium]
MADRKLGLLLSTPPSHPSVETVVELAQAALRQGIEVYLYLIDEGVKTAMDQRYLRLIDAGVKMSVCAYGCQRYGIPTVTVDSRASLSGLVVLSGIIDGCDRFLAFT